MGGIEWIHSRNDLANYIGVPPKVLTYLLYIKKTENLYTTFEIPKKNGEARKICAPNDELKAVQKKLMLAILSYVQEIRKKEEIRVNIAHGFEKDKGIITNAAIHRNKRFVLNLDLNDFFDSFHFGRVVGYFEKNRHFRFSYEVAVTIAQLVCYNGKLPQGAPTSPIITNLICQPMDYHILNLAKKYKLDYTRYADDLTFSTNNHLFLDDYDEFMSELSEEIQNMGFSINPAKTRLRYRDSRQEVTGLVVNKRISVPSKFYRETRAMAHELYTTGSFNIGGIPATLNQLEGRFSFIDQVEHYNNKHDNQKHLANTLSGRERQYQAFLFYKYFFANEKPIILTEGKTDILYIKAALMHMYQDYPVLISRAEDGKFTFHISFLKRSERWKYFFNIQSDGADTFKYLYCCFCNQSNDAAPNYLEYFTRLTGAAPKSQTILLLDNELNNKSKNAKPLQKFCKAIGLRDSEKNELQSNYYIQLVEQSKLYLLTNPLVAGKTESEIEDLFTVETLSHEIRGRAFSRDDKVDLSKHYGKNEFSKYVFSNYQTIDFSGFKPLLDALSKIVAT